MSSLLLLGEEREDQAVALLRSRYLEDRLNGMEQLRERGQNAEKLLLNLLDDNESRVAYAAATLLGELKNPRSCDKLYEMVLGNPAKYCTEVLPILAELGSEAYRVEIFDLVDSEDEELNALISATIHKVCSIDKVLKRAITDGIALLKSGNERNRFAAGVVLAGLGAGAVNALILALEEEHLTSLAASAALTKIGEPAIPALLQNLKDSTRVLSVRIRLAEALFAIESSNLIAPFFWVMKNEENPLIREQAAVSLISFTGEELSEAFFLAVNDPAANVREAALMAFSHLSEPPEGLPVNLIISRLGDAAPSVRKAAIGTCGRMKLGDSYIPMLALLGDEDPEVAMNAAWSIGNFENPEAISALTEFAQMEHLKVPVAKSLLQLGEPGKISELYTALRSNSQRRYAIYGLSFSRDRNAVEAIINVIPNLEPEEIPIARYSLFAITGAYLELHLWKDWWARYGKFWHFEQREGIFSWFVAREYVIAGILHAADEYFIQAAQSAPSFPPALLNGAEAHLRKGDPNSVETAESLLKKALLLEENDEYYLLLARLYMFSGRYSMSLECVEKGISLKGNFEKELKKLQEKILDRMPR